MATNDQNARSRESRREAGLVQRVRASLRHEYGRTQRPTILVACSGGRDSVVLAHVLGALARTGDLSAELVHVDHAVRDDSREAAEIVDFFARDLGLPLHVRRLDPGIADNHLGVGLEEALRRERYRAFADVAEAIGADAVAVAHHQRDQAETVLLHLIRGAGLAGASGMREWSSISVPWWERGSHQNDLRIWRPLLDEAFETIDKWHLQNRLPLADDSTNVDRMFRRNAIRHDVLPQLESINPGTTGNMARFAKLAAEDDAWLDWQAETVLRSSAVHGLERSTLVGSGPAIQRRILRRWLMDQGYDGELTLDRVDAIRDLAFRNRSGALVEIGSRWSVRMSAGVLVAVPPEQVP